MNVSPFLTREEREIAALHDEVDSLRAEIQSLSENLTDIMEKMAVVLEITSTGAEHGRLP